MYKCYHSTCLPNARLGAFIDGATGKLMNFPISTGLSNLISWRCVDIDLAAPYCDSTHSYGFRFLTTCTISLISRLRWTESQRTVRTATTNSMVSSVRFGSGSGDKLVTRPVPGSQPDPDLLGLGCY